MVGVRGFHARETKRSCACDCGRRPVSVGAFFILLLLLSFFFSHPESCLEIKIFVRKSDVLGGRGGGGPRGAPGRKKNEKMKK